MIHFFQPQLQISSIYRSFHKIPKSQNNLKTFWKINFFSA